MRAWVTLIAALVFAGTASACNCITPSDTTPFTSRNMPSTYGSSCAAWDDGDCTRHDCTPGYGCDDYYTRTLMGSWCCSPWCFVTGTDCPDAQESTLSTGLYYSYTFCDGTLTNFDSSSSSSAEVGIGASESSSGSSACPWSATVSFEDANAFQCFGSYCSMCDEFQASPLTSTTWERVKGEWEWITENVDNVSDGMVSCRTTGAGDILWTGDDGTQAGSGGGTPLTQWTSFALDTRIRPDSGFGDAGVIFLATAVSSTNDAGRYYYVGLYPGSGEVVLGFMDGNWNRLSSAYAGIQQSRWYELRVVVDPAPAATSSSKDPQVRIRVSIDGQLLITQIHGMYVTGGVGLRGFRCAASYDLLHVTASFDGDGYDQCPPSPPLVWTPPPSLGGGSVVGPIVAFVLIGAGVSVYRKYKRNEQSQGATPQGATPQGASA